MFGILTNSLFKTSSMMWYVCVKWGEIVKGWLTLHSACQQLISWKDQYSRGQWEMMKKTNVHVKLAFLLFWRTNVRHGQQFFHLRCIYTESWSVLHSRWEDMKAWKIECKHLKVVVHHAVSHAVQTKVHSKHEVLTIACRGRMWRGTRQKVCGEAWMGISGALAADWCPKMSISWLPWEKKKWFGGLTSECPAAPTSMGVDQCLIHSWVYWHITDEPTSNRAILGHWILAFQAVKQKKCNGMSHQLS